MEKRKTWWQLRCKICSAKGILSDPHFHTFTNESPHIAICENCWLKAYLETGWHKCEDY